ncbi:ataxin-3 isoform X2 [Scleropages formosus]|uniref:ataxin-3 isoform X2 n=1 Tax=Scleropages formosus TaxID=113540 RepID=UPI00087814D7|nr:ataxin-3 isoform X2 [Scleropages formosus]
MESIFHEKQEGSLCAQHCLNNLLQGEYFTPVELSSIAHQLDEEERIRMAEGGVTSEEYRTFLQQPSGNMDDSGFFSIQVISNALRVWGLELILFNSREYQQLMIDPINEKAFICNYKEHWFTVRKLGQQWFNLNSLLTGPELISDTYLALFLAQLQQEGAAGTSNTTESSHGGTSQTAKSTQAQDVPSQTPGGTQSEKLSAEELRKRRQAYFDRQSQQQAQSTSPQQNSQGTGRPESEKGSQAHDMDTKHAQ